MDDKQCSYQPAPDRITGKWLSSCIVASLMKTDSHVERRPILCPSNARTKLPPRQRHIPRGGLSIPLPRIDVVEVN
jgi:hypothetical protein